MYNFTGPQGFGIANATDSLYAIKRLVFEEKKLTLEEFKDALDNNFGKGLSKERVEYLTVQILEQMAAAGQEITLGVGGLSGADGEEHTLISGKEDKV